MSHTAADPHCWNRSCCVAWKDVAVGGAAEEIFQIQLRRLEKNELSLKGLHKIIIKKLARAGRYLTIGRASEGPDGLFAALAPPGDDLC